MQKFTEYIEFQKGNTPLLISVPHGGIKKSEFIPKRTQGILGIDGETVKIAKNLIEAIKKQNRAAKIENINPSYIISNVRRSRIDLNRKPIEAYSQNSPIAKDIYNFYHSTINEIIMSNLKLYSRSLLVDIHGFEKERRPVGFRDVDIILGTNNLKSFFPEPVPKREWGNTIRGKIIQKLTDLSIPIAPGHPTRKEYVLKGGLITKIYGASQIQRSQAMQIEFSDKIRLYDKELRNLVLKTLAEAFSEYLIKP
jgi:N-formylglutamate amidohydrolase